jgi:protein-disulfide isomerase
MEFRITFALIGVIIVSSALSAQTSPPRQPIARIGEQAIYEEDLLPIIGGQLMQIRNQEYELKTKALVTLVNRRLLEEEAKNEGVSTETFLEQKVDRDLPPPTASEIEAYYLAQKDRLNRPLEEIKPQLEPALVQARRQQARQGYLDRLRQKAAVSILLSRPKVDITADPSRLRGSPDAPVTIVEFSDFQCSYCQAAQKTLKELLDKYTGKVRLGFRDFPLKQIHPQAQQAAEASRCAGEHGKFWEYHDLLYANQAKLDFSGLTEDARAAGLDVQAFSLCLASGKFKAPIESDLQAGTISGVSGTPAFYINGVPLSGVQPASAFEKIIESELAKSVAKKPAP